VSPLRALGVAALALAGLAAAAGVCAVNDRPDPADWPLEPAAPAAGPGVSVTFLGVATLLFDDGRSALLTDGFFTRPGALDVLLDRPVAPDPARVEAGLARAGVARLGAVVVVHSHYDHAMDAPEVARQTGALLVGSASTANVGRGAGLAEEQIVVLRPGASLYQGAFRVSLVPSRHVPLPGAAGDILGRAIEEPLVPPAPPSAWLEGGSFSVVIEHPRGTAVVQGSAGFEPGALAGVEAGAVFLGVGNLARQGPAYADDYWREVVLATGARRVFPIHWDDFTRPSDRPLVPFPRLLDDADAALALLAERARAGGVALLRLPPFERVALF
jgi:L-ascorbate metabolism protein UlaG (beta-lactamase superfamily)